MVLFLFGIARAVAIHMGKRQHAFPFAVCFGLLSRAASLDDGVPCHAGRVQRETDEIEWRQYDIAERKETHETLRNTNDGDVTFREFTSGASDTGYISDCGSAERQS